MYQKGIETKKNIITVARKLFYEQGYQATTTRQIAEELDINLGLFSYYFKNKATMGTYIYKIIRRELSNCLDVHPLLKDNIKLYTTVNVLADAYMLAQNNKLGLFYYELAAEPELKKYMSAMIQDAIKEYYKASNKDFNQLTPEMLISMSVIPGAKPTMIYTAHRSNLHLSPIEYANYYMRMYFYFVLNEKKDEVEKLLKTGNKILLDFDFKVTGGFKLEFNDKNLISAPPQTETYEDILKI